MDRCSPSARASSMDCMGTMTSPARWRRDPRDDVISRVRHGQQQYTSTTTAPIKTRTAPMTTPVIRDKNWYRDGPHMVAKIFMIGIKYACNKNINENLIWMQSQFQRTLNMLAISNSKRTLYACNLFQKGPNMLAMSKIDPEWRNYDSDNSLENKILMIASIFGPHWKRLKAYIVRFKFEIARILSFLSNWDWKHIKSPFLSWLQVYYVPVIIIIATICGPTLYLKKCFQLRVSNTVKSLFAI